VAVADGGTSSGDAEREPVEAKPAEAESQQD
jgi:hypothetical protein